MPSCFLFKDHEDEKNSETNDVASPLIWDRQPVCDGQQLFCALSFIPVQSSVPSKRRLQLSVSECLLIFLRTAAYSNRPKVSGKGGDWHEKFPHYFHPQFLICLYRHLPRRPFTPPALNLEIELEKRKLEMSTFSLQFISRMRQF